MSGKKHEAKERSNEKSDANDLARTLSDSITQVIVSLLTLCKEVSLVGFLVISVVSLILVWGSEDQKRAIIDRYILFQGVSGHVICTAVIAALVVVMSMGFIFFRKMLSLEKKEVKRLSDWKTEYQNVFDRPLNSSK